MDASVNIVKSTAPPAAIGERTGDEASESRKNTVRHSPDAVRHVVNELNESLRAMKSKVSFSFDQASGKVIIRVLDGDTQEVLRQIPTEDMLRVSAHIKALLGVLYDKAV